MGNEPSQEVRNEEEERRRRNQEAERRRNRNEEDGGPGQEGAALAIMIGLGIAAVGAIAAVANSQGGAANPSPISAGVLNNNQDDTMENYVAIDCEYISGRQSILTHVAVVTTSGEVLLEAKRENAFGVESLYNVKIRGEVLGSMSLASCRTRIASLLKGKVLVGHDLRQDLNVLSLTHPEQYTRDTAFYRPFMQQTNHSNNWQPRTLRELAREHLGRDLASNRHNPVEDARAAMDLFMLVKDDMESQL